ncbi:YjgN family protein [Agarivorans sp. TSD2052]|uniref:YjgN family protein n=1 Tax=Agarivorans sp. TSD2052 TaxID=2937286 RepID=UPI00200FAD3C|nr:YjgN family protein [Agarivorans sp. TSD2052]UPW19733.1 YjgN family protein [Agarivorans sp. TSD2052]
MDSQTKKNNPFYFNGKVGEYFGIWIVNVLLTILTLGIYSAWAKVRNKQYFYGNTELADESFEYLAKPLQILVGRIIAVVLLIAWATLPAVSEAASVILGLAFVALMPVLVVRNLRFDCRVTRYRNVRFNFSGSYGGAYMALFVLPVLYVLGFMLVVSAVIFVSSLISPVVAGIVGVVVVGLGATYMYALMTTQMSRYVLNGYQWGELQFIAEIDVNAVFKVFLKVAAIGLLATLVLMLALAGIAFAAFNADFSQLGGVLMQLSQGGLQDALSSQTVILGLLAAVYLSFFLLGWFVTAYLQACLRNYQFGQTELDGQLYMNSEVKPLAFLGVMLSNMLICVFSLGLAIPLAKIRMAKFIADATSVTGDITHIATQNQVSDTKAAIADEVADAFSIEIGVI